jgi:hypothetical protein
VQPVRRNDRGAGRPVERIAPVEQALADLRRRPQREKEASLSPDQVDPAQRCGMSFAP